MKFGGMVCTVRNATHDRYSRSLLGSATISSTPILVTGSASASLIAYLRPADNKRSLMTFLLEYGILDPQRSFLITAFLESRRR